MDTNVKVFVRLRPPMDNEINEDGTFDCSIVGYDDMTEIQVCNTPLWPLTQPSITHRQEHESEDRVFSYNGVFGSDTSQSLVYEQTAEPLVNEVVKGYNGTLLAYGQTGTG